MPHSPPPRGSSVVPLAVPPDDAPTVITRPKPDPPVPAAGEFIGPYEVLGVAGAGGMAAVLRARDPALGREVAVKLLPPDLAADPEAVARFRLEARAAAQLDHDAIARVFACGEDAGRPYIAFEFVEGETLRDAIDRRGPLPPGECVAVLAQVAAGLVHAAGRGVVHRDIKPSNLILTPAGRVKIVDMGLARSGPADGGVTRSGVTLGTFDYISPEQALDPRRADPRSDIYSLGCTIYHACTGRPPVPPGTAARKLQAHRDDPVLDPRVLNPGVPLGLAQLLATMMAKNPARRYQTPADLLRTALGLAAELGVPADRLPAGPAAAPAAAAPGRGGLWAGLAAAGAAVLVAAGLLAPPRPGPSAPPWEATHRPTAEVPATEPPRPSPPGPVQTAATVADLVKAVGAPETTTVRLAAGKLFDLTALPDGLLVGGRPAFTLEAAEGTVPPTLRLAAAPPDEPDRWDRARPGSLTVSGVPTVTLRGVRVEVAGGPPPTTADRPAGLVVADADAVSVDTCRFDPTADPPDAVGLLVARTAGPGTLAVRKTLFNRRLGGGLAVSGPVKATLVGCGFGPLPAGVRLAGGGGALSLTGCKFLLDHGAAVELDPGADASIDAGGCVFAAPPPDPAALAAAMMGDPPARPAVVRADGLEQVRFSGRPGESNLYYGTDAVGAGGQVLGVAAGRPPGGPFHDPAADDRKTHPWAADPLAAWDRDPWQALRVGPTSTDPAGRVKVWWPAADAPDRHTFARLDDALKALRPGDELHVRHAGELPFAGLTWDKPWRLVVRPYPGSSPVLVPGPRPAGPDPAAVRLLAGEVLLDGLAVKLARPGAVVAVAGGKGVQLSRCTLTVDDPAAVAVRLVGRGEPAAVALVDTLVRGRGGVLAAGDRAADLTLTNCWAAVGGPLVASDSGAVRATLSRVTAAGAVPPFDPRGGRLTVTAERCVFHPLGGRPLPAPRADLLDFGDDGRLVEAGVRFAGMVSADRLAEVTRADLVVVAPDLPPGGAGAEERDMGKASGGR